MTPGEAQQAYIDLLIPLMKKNNIKIEVPDNYVYGTEHKDHLHIYECKDVREGTYGTGAALEANFETIHDIVNKKNIITSGWQYR